MSNNMQMIISNQKKLPKEFQNTNHSEDCGGNESSESEPGIPEFNSQYEDSIEDEVPVPDIHERDCTARGSPPRQKIHVHSPIDSVHHETSQSKELFEEKNKIQQAEIIMTPRKKLPETFIRFKTYNLMRSVFGLNDEIK